MSVPELGVLRKVSVREAWPHEATSFTPWLADHLDALGSVIGIPLEFEGREVAVETFSADILARNPQDDSLVLIENQLEGADHAHLGQIMTYLAGLEAQTVVWVASDFREAHLSALKWLNDHTEDPFALFAVKVRAVRIGDSPIAPMFEVMERPNRWERQLHALVQETGALSERGQFRKEFWTAYIDRFPDERRWGPPPAHSTRWRVLDDLGLVLSLYVAKASVGIFVRPPLRSPADGLFERLAPHADRLATALEADMGGPDSTHFLTKDRAANPEDRAAWPDVMDWLHSTADAYEAALREIFEGDN